MHTSKFAHISIYEGVEVDSDVFPADGLQEVYLLLLSVNCLGSCAVCGSSLDMGILCVRLCCPFIRQVYRLSSYIMNSYAHTQEPIPVSVILLQHLYFWQ